MKDGNLKKGSGLTLKSMFKFMMENGYSPSFESGSIQFDLGSDIAVVEYNEGIMSARLFYTIGEDQYDLFLEASNMAMLKSYATKIAVLDSMTDLMFSCEFPCGNLRDFKRFLPIAIDRLKETIKIHKEEMRRLIIASGVVSATIPATDNSMAGTGKRKIIS